MKTENNCGEKSNFRGAENIALFIASRERERESGGKLSAYLLYRKKFIVRCCLLLRYYDDCNWLFFVLFERDRCIYRDIIVKEIYWIRRGESDFVCVK